MHNVKHRPWLFGVCAALILLAGGTVVGLAARLVVAPQAGEMVEQDTPSIPSILGQSVDEVTFYPWTVYDQESFESNISETMIQERMDWYRWNIDVIPSIFGFYGMEYSVNNGQIRNYSGYWTECPVTTQDGQSALMDVAFGKDYQDFGMSWVAYSTGELPTRTQKEAALSTVQQDVCRMFAAGQDSELEDLILQVWNQLQATSFPDSTRPLNYEWYAMGAMENVITPIQTVQEMISVTSEQSVQEQLAAISSAAQKIDFHVQLVTTQRQVVLVMTSVAADMDCWWSVGVYYDMVLEQYSGIVVNDRAGYGF